MKITLTAEQFETLRTLLSQAAGLVFDDTRRESMAYSIAERLRETGIQDVDAYLERLHDPLERQRLLDEVTIQETHFFRNPPQVRALRQFVLPELIRHAETQGRRVRIWSAGCSTGEEPYSIAMMLRELMPSQQGWDVKVLATDVSQRALAAARAGVYGARAVMNAHPDDLARHFLPPVHGSYEVRPEVRELVEFRHHNLVTEAVPFAVSERVDLVLCRNVTIYFSRATTRDLMKRLHECLRDGGYLFLGHSETLWQVSEAFHLVALGTGEAAAFVYRRLDAKPGGPERRDVLPDRRTASEPPAVDRRVRPRRTERPRPAHVAAPAPQPAPPGAGPDALIAQARGALADGRYGEAAAFAQQAVAVAPLRGEAFYLRGLAAVNVGDDSGALVELRKAVYLAPDMGFAHFLLAGVLDRLGDGPAAAREYAAAADTLGNVPADETAEELGGRSVRELAQLCRDLERRHNGAHVEGVG